MSKADRHRRPARRSQIETLEDRLAMSADGLLLFASDLIEQALQDLEPVAVSQQVIVEEAPAISHHDTVVEEEPALTHHDVVVDDVPGISHHDVIVEDIPGISHHDNVIDAAPPLGHHDVVEYDPNADFWLDPLDLVGEDEITGDSLSSAHDQTGLDQIVADYGFTGAGQTIAVIDSGIAYDHYALGGGYGSDYRVVGGWDFTENDADPYDDGSAGGHGSHVAGIIGSDDESSTGVAPGVDLVGLRVFDDAGNGYFSWVEDALQWVIDNHNAFENPITAINLSLGVTWNSDSIPSWAMLEDEFAQIEAAGIFISVSAGNDFTSYNETGLSYPAASPYVVPVMSTDDNGNLSYYSQRSQSAIAAPGRTIVSTVPDYMGNNNGIDDDWASMSGTSMAAPYVAGASAIIREAMEFVGYTDIDQDTIYSHMLATADTFVDSTTGLEFSRLNVEAAIDALMPTDDYGSSEGAAYDLGTINGGASTQSLMEINGVISTLSDADFFTFTAGSTGTVTFTAANATHHLDVSWTGYGGEGWSDVTGDVYTMNVTAGQQYTVSLESLDGLGYYDLAVTATISSVFEYTDWDTVGGQETHSGVTADAAAWYRVVAGQDGYLTIAGLNPTGSVDLGLYDADLNLIVDAGASDRLDHAATAGTEYYLRVEGDGGTADIQLTNLVSESGSAVTVAGTTGADTLAFTAGANDHTVTVNGVEYTFAASSYDTFTLNGGNGEDTVTLTGSASDETFTLRVGQTTVASDTYSLTATDIENVDATGGGGTDNAYVFDSASDDVYNTYSDRVEMTGDGYSSIARGMDRTYGYASGGYDIANFNDTAADDTFAAWSDRAIMYGDGFSNEAEGFSRTYAYSTTGDDRAFFYDTSGNDTYVGWSDRAIMYGDGYSNETHGFVRNYAYATSGDDRAFFHDTDGDDTYIGRSDRAKLYGDGYSNEAYNFTRTYAYATSGNDRVFLYDTTGADTYIGWSDRARMYGDGYYNEAWGFNRTWAYASTGADRAFFYDTDGADTYIGWSDRSRMYGDDYYNEVHGFAKTYAYASTGSDRAIFKDSADADHLRTLAWGAYVTGDDYRNESRGFAQVIADGGNEGADSLYAEAVDYAFDESGDWV